MAVEKKNDKNDTTIMYVPATAENVLQGQDAKCIIIMVPTTLYYEACTLRACLCVLLHYNNNTSSSIKAFFFHYQVILNCNLYCFLMNKTLYNFYYQFIDNDIQYTVVIASRVVLSDCRVLIGKTIFTIILAVEYII